MFLTSFAGLYKKLYSFKTCQFSEQTGSSYSARGTSIVDIMLDQGNVSEVSSGCGQSRRQRKSVGRNVAGISDTGAGSDLENSGFSLGDQEQTSTRGRGRGRTIKSSGTPHSALTQITSVVNNTISHTAGAEEILPDSTVEKQLEQQIDDLRREYFVFFLLGMGY